MLCKMSIAGDFPSNPRSTASIAGHPIHPMLIPFPIAFFIATFVCDLAYWQTTPPPKEIAGRLGGKCSCIRRTAFGVGCSLAAAKVIVRIITLAVALL